MKELLLECDLNINAISEFAKGKQLSCISLAKIADYLDCSVDHLLGRETAPQTVNNGDINNNNGVNHGVIGRINKTNNEEIINSTNLTTQERDLLRIYKNATTHQQIKLMDCALSIEEKRKI